MNKLIKPPDVDSYELEEPSDEERAASRFELIKASKNDVALAVWG